MKVPPRNPHFLKPIHPGFKHGTKIPVGFLKYLKGQEEKEHAVLRRAGKKWKVKLNGQILEEGWEKFAEEHDLQVGNILVFRYDGNMEFEVAIFDSSHCDTQYAEHLQDEEEAHTVEETSKEFEFKGLTAPESQVPASTSADDGVNPYFISTIKPYTNSNPVLLLPTAFVKSNGLMNKREMTLVDGKRRQWPVRLGPMGRSFGIKKMGWTKFMKANEVRVGDTFKFELINNEIEPIVYFHCKYSGKGFHLAEDSTHNPIGRSHFECTIKAKFYLRLPGRFAKENGLIDKKCGLIVRDGHESWNLRLYTSGSQVFVGGSWRKFCVANDLKVGDLLRFEVFTNGETPIWKVYGKAKPGSLSLWTAFHPKEAYAHNPIGQSHFECTIKRYCLSSGYLRVPRQFAKKNGLTNKKCGLIIRGDGRISWNLKLYTSCSQVYVGGRWGRFCVANDLKVGDQIRFEVVTNGEKPIWKFHEKPEHKSKNTPGKTFPNNLEDAKDMHLNGPHFICTVSSYCLSMSFLKIPKKFARDNGLNSRKCKILVRDEQRSWTFNLYTCSQDTFFGSGWRKFCVDNCFKERDRLIFELVSNGETPVFVFRFYGKFLI